MTLSRLTRTGLFKRWSGVDEHIGPEVRLFRAVLDRALIDYFSSDREIRKEVVSWLKEDDLDFQYVCQAALMKPHVVLTIFKEMKKTLKNKERDRD
jgi:hypothetical protein